MATRVNRRKTIIHHVSDMERWIIPAILISILIHIGLTFLLQRIHLPEVTPEKITFAEQPSFKLESVSVQPIQAQKETHLASVPKPVKLPEEKPDIGKNQSSNVGLPSAPSVSSQLLSEKPDAPDMAKNLLSSSFPVVESRSNRLEKQLLQNKPDITPAGQDGDSATKILKATAVTHQGPSAGDKAPGFSNLDSLLAQTGPLQAETAPILMPTDVLFEYDQDMLLTAAVGSLQKLGLLIQRNPTATFVIEGHTDSFGSDDYNMVLSLRRAESVKTWLVQNMKIDSNRIQTQGYGKTRLLSPATGTIEQQQLNRRVEIVIHTH